jgi:uncharacterized membrane-anchored protein
MTELEIDSWYRELFYNDATKNLEWCTQLRQKGETELLANHNTRILGRHGVTQITLVADLDQRETAIPELSDILKSYEYQAGERYAEYRQGDKIAKYGLAMILLRQRQEGLKYSSADGVIVIFRQKEGEPRFPMMILR